MSGWAAPLPRRSGAAMAGRAPPSNLIMTSLCCAASSRGIPADAANQKALFILSPQLKPKLNRGGGAVIGGGQGRERTRVIDGALGGVVRGLVPTALGDVHVAHRSVPHEFEGDDGGRKGMDTRIHVSGVPFLGNALPQDRHIVSEPVAERRSLPDAHAARADLPHHGRNQGRAGSAIKLVGTVLLLGAPVVLRGSGHFGWLRMIAALDGDGIRLLGRRQLF